MDINEKQELVLKSLQLYAQSLKLHQRKLELNKLIGERIDKRLEMVFLAEKEAVKKARETLEQTEEYKENEQYISLMRDEWLQARDQSSKLRAESDKIQTGIEVSNKEAEDDLG